MALEFDVNELSESLNKFALSAEAAINKLAQAQALNLENYAKEHKPWTNRTGQARQRLKGISKQTSEFLWEITLSHGVDYGIYLEFAHEKKYAIIFPTINLKSPEVLKSFEGLVEKLSSKL